MCRDVIVQDKYILKINKSFPEIPGGEIRRKLELLYLDIKGETKVKWGKEMW